MASSVAVSAFPWHPLSGSGPVIVQSGACRHRVDVVPDFGRYFRSTDGWKHTVFHRLMSGRFRGRKIRAVVHSLALHGPHPPMFIHPRPGTSSVSISPRTMPRVSEDSRAARRPHVAHETANVELRHIPPRSPDLNPVERLWGWLRKRLRAMDLADLKAGRKAVKTRALKARVSALLRSQAAKKVGRSFLLSLRKTCEDVNRRRGAASAHG